MSFVSDAMVFFAQPLNLLTFDSYPQKYQQLRMKTLCLKYFQHINKIISIMQPNLISKTQRFKTQIQIENSLQISNEQLLEHELSTLKQNILNLLKHCQGLQNHIKMSKKSFPSPSQILQQNHYEIRSADLSQTQNFFLSTSSQKKSQPNLTSLIQRQNEELKKTRQLYLDSLSKIHQLKTEVSGLTLKLNHFSQVFDTPSKKKIEMSCKQDLLAKELSMSCNFDKNMSSTQDEIDIETLLCHQDLDMDSPLLKENSSLRSNRENRVVESLISKGIEYRDKRSLKSSEFKELSTIVQRYREESLSNFKPLQMKKSKTTCYR